MKIVVIGAGIVGITTAYELACDGHDVTVVERRGAAAEETSFANAGIIAPGYVTPWAAPDMPSKVMRNLFNRHAPVKLGLPLTINELTWMWKWYRACKPDAYLANRSKMQRLAFYSHKQLHQTITNLKLDYDRSEGYVVLLRTEKDSLGMQPGLNLLRDAGVTFKQIDTAETRKIEPALNPDIDFFGAIHLPDDEVGNCRQFALLLKNEAVRIGAKFLFNKKVTQITSIQGISLAFEGTTSSQQFDAAVMCGGVNSIQLLDPLGIKLPMVAVYGYSVSASIKEPLNAPRSAVMDEHYKVAISRLGNRVRVAGSAEIGGSLDIKRTSSLQTLYKVLHDWFPGAAHHSSGVQEWKGARAMLPDGPPILGASGIKGLWLNLGHGSSGWALSSGSARVVADLLKNKKPEVDISDLGIHRFRA